MKSDPFANIFQTPRWIDAICAAGGYTNRTMLYEMSDGRRLILPMVRRTGVPGVLLPSESLPSQWGVGGIVATGGRLLQEDVSALWDALKSRPLAGVRIRPEGQTAATWEAGRPVRGVRVNPQTKSVVDLSGGFSKVWEAYKPPARNKARKAERAGIVIQSGSTEDLAKDYYDLYLLWTSQSAQEAGLPPSLMLRRARAKEPFRKYQEIVTRLSSASSFWVARHEGRPVAASILLIHGQHATYWRGFSDKTAAGPTGANNLLQKEMMEYACQSGCLEYNMGWSGTESLLNFKASFGARELPYPVYTNERLPLEAIDETMGRLRTRLKRAAGQRGH